MMAGLILKSPYYKPGSKTKKGGTRGGLANYIATREGVEVLRSGMADYINDRRGSNGLFTDEGETINMAAIMKEVDEHPGNVWCHIFSLTREDAERLGYNRAEEWMNLLRSHRNDIAREMGIDPANLRWYAAFHQHPTHPHVHMMVWSQNPTEAYLSKKGIQNIKQFMAQDTAFHFEQIAYMVIWRDMEDDYGVIPFPKYDDAQETYLSLVHDTANMYGVPVDCRNIDAVCALMEALAVDSHKNVMSVYYSQVLKGKYARDTVSGQILDIIHDHPVADFAYINGFGFNTVIRYICNSTGTNTYVSEIKGMMKMKENDLKKLIKQAENNG